MSDHDLLLDFHPLSILSEQMKYTDPKQRANSLKNLRSISIALGPEKTRALLLPFLKEILREEEDEVKIQCISCIPQLIQLIGGPAYSMRLIQLLFDTLSFSKASDDIINHYLGAIQQILVNIKVRDFEKEFFSMITKLCEEEAHEHKSQDFLLRLMPQILMGSSEYLHKQLTYIIQDISKSNIPMVRKAVSNNMKDLVQLIPPLSQEFIETLFDQLVRDDNDFVRNPLLGAMILLMKSKASKGSEEPYNQLIKIFAQDQIWKVRFTFIENIQGIYQLFEQQLVFDYLQQFLVDPEVQFKNQILQKIGDFLNCFGYEQFAKYVLPSLRTLAKSEKNHLVRSNLGEAIISLLNVMEKPLQTLDLVVIDFIQQSDFETKYQFLSKIKSFQKFNNFIPNSSRAFYECALIIFGNQQWRMRLSSISVLGQFIMDMKKFLQADPENVQNILNFIFESFQDQVYNVRIQSSQTFKIFLLNITNKEINTEIQKQIQEIYETQENYLYRIPFLLGFSKSVEHFDINRIQTFVISDLLTFLVDSERVPNNQLSILQTIKALTAKYPEFQKNQDILQFLNNYINQGIDADVRYLAKTIMKE